LVFAHDGAFHAETVTLPADRLDLYDRLIDLLREEPSITRQLYVDMRKLVSASLVDDEEAGDPPADTA
jgi:hypothetical protein